MGKIAKALKKIIQSSIHQPVVKLSDFRAAKEKAECNIASMRSAESLVKEGYEASHALYINAQHLTTVFAEEISVLPPLHCWHNFMTENEDLYSPTGPPMSPLTSSYFTFWTLFDASFGGDRETIGSIFSSLSGDLKLDPFQSDIIKNLSQSRMGIYEIAYKANSLIELKELLTEKTFTTLFPGGYKGKIGDLVFTRLVPTFDGKNHYISITTPYVFVGNPWREWQMFFERNGIKKNTVGFEPKLHKFLKYGKNRRYWSEFIFEAYFNHKEDRIFLTGIPDRPETLPHSEKFDTSKIDYSLIESQLQETPLREVGAQEVKASEIFLKFAEPMFEIAPPNVTAKDLAKHLKLLEIIWNAVAMEEWDSGKKDCVKMIYEQLAKAPNPEFGQAETVALVDMWVKRKKELFPDAKWAFQIEVLDGKGGPIIRAHTRIPDHLRHTVPLHWRNNMQFKNSAESPREEL